MGRPERGLDPEAGPLERFAWELRQLRATAGRLSYRELSKRAHFSVTALSEAAGGREVPSLAVTLAYVQACGGDGALWEARWHAVVDELAVADGVTDSESVNAPYLGLSSFEPHHAAWFFGRQELVTELRSRVEREPLVAVFGASGSGKSSLLRAGLLPGVRAGSVPGGESWTTILLTPGRHPVEELAARLAHLLGVAATSVCADLTADPKSIGVLWCQVLVAGPGARRVLLVVDQFEEIFTLCDDPEERAAFIDCVVASTAGRDDRGRDCSWHTGRFLRLVRAVLRTGGRPARPSGACGADGCVVREPGLRAGMKVEAALVVAVVADAHGEPGALPLVSHALYETWKRRSGNAMTLARYRMAGGVQGAIAQSAERVYAELDETERSLAKNVFLRLTALGQGTEDTRRRVTRAELLGGAADLIGGGRLRQSRAPSTSSPMDKVRAAVATRDSRRTTCNTSSRPAQ
nr:helix-turn-helix domain-containing protein [Streptomyces sp. NBC_00830]